jgi:4-amino-4-deoxy-L-arabinose transferase-like glycosyltransferase
VGMYVIFYFGIMTILIGTYISSPEQRLKILLVSLLITLVIVVMTIYLLKVILIKKQIIINHDHLTIDLVHHGEKKFKTQDITHVEIYSQRPFKTYLRVKIGLKNNSPIWFDQFWHFNKKQIVEISNFLHTNFDVPIIDEHNELELIS